MKRFFFTTVAALCVAITSVARDGFAIVVDPVSYQKARTEVDAYARAIEDVHNLKVYIVEDRWGQPDSIRRELLRLHSQKTEPIVGCVLVGDIPIVMVRDGQHMTSAFKMNQKQPRFESSVPSDRFYDDFGLKFSYIGCDTVKPATRASHFYYSVDADGDQRTHPDLYSGRIRPTDCGGTSRYDKLKAYLTKATEAKRQTRQMQQLFFFSGHGYISESKVARLDEKAVFMEHFPELKDNINRIGYMDHSDENPVKEKLMNELMRPDLDVAVLHHHGYWDTEYLNGTDRPYTVREAKTYIMRNIRQHIYAAYQKGKNVDSVKTAILERFDLPESWAENCLSDSQARLDSLYDAATDLHLEDFEVYGYKPNTPVVIIDACFCGSFHKSDCIANEYIFQPGGTIAVLANTVNSLQDKWSDRFIGLLSQGGCVGDMARFSTFLESHVIGDPTYRFATAKGTPDIDHLILAGKAADWRRLLKNGTPEQQALAIDRLQQLGAIASQELLSLYISSPYAIVRFQAMRSIVDCHDDNTIALLQKASQDANELIQRFAVKYIGQSGDERLLPALMTLSIANNTSDRVVFDAGQVMPAYTKEALLKEFARQFDTPAVQYIRKDSIRSVIEKAIVSNATKVASDVAECLNDTVNIKERRLNLRSTRNIAVHHLVPQLLEYVQTTADEEMRLLIIEALGWHPLTCQRQLIGDTMQAIRRDTKYSQAVRDEALKTYNRLYAK